MATKFRQSLSEFNYSAPPLFEKEGLEYLRQDDALF